MSPLGAREVGQELVSDKLLVSMYGFTSETVNLAAIRERIARMSDLYGQSLPDPLWRCGKSLRTTHDHVAQ